MVFQDWIKGFAYNSKKEGFDPNQVKNWVNNYSIPAIRSSTNETGISQNRTSIDVNTGKIAENTTNISGNTTDISENTANISGNKTNISGNTTNISDNTTSITGIQSRLDALENYEISNDGYGRIIGAQQRLINITEQEKDRLDNIHQNYRDQDDNRDKMQMLMLSEKDKQNKYMLLAVIFAFVFVVAFFLTYIQNVKKNKSVWFDIIMVLLIAAALIYAIVVYIDIQNRDPNNFSKLAPDSDSLLVVQTRTGDGKHGVKYGIAATTDLQGGGCKGDACCGPGSYWDEVNGRCIRKV